MEESEKTLAEEWLKNLPVQGENPAFKAEELIACTKCSRMNAPNRLNCLYCGEKLEISDERVLQLKLNLRKMELWEKGVNLIYLPGKSSFDSEKTPEISKILNLERETFQKIVDADIALPLARVESEKEAQIAKHRLEEFGITVFTLSDEALALEKPHRRLRGLEFSDDKLILIFFNTDEIAEISSEDLSLIVTGAIFERKVEALEKRVKKGDNKILQTSETSSDELLFDIYSRNDSIGYRILAKGFDFSCLGREKEILAKDNLKKLAQKLRAFAPEAKTIENYLQVREGLADIWKVEERSDSQGIKRQSFGNYNLGNITTVNNSAQFNKYSRLQWHLL